MNEFVNKLNQARFEATNSLWNELRLNDPWSVGYVTTLIEMKGFKQKEDWEAFYYQTGSERNEKLKAYPTNIIQLLNDNSLLLTNKTAHYRIAKSIKNLNYNFGRTPEQLAEKGKILYDKANQQGLNISPSECVEAVRFRVICQTWNGIVIRERNAIRTLQRLFPILSFHSTNGVFDHQYAVDYEVKQAEQLIFGIQIKPKSYLGNAPYIQRAKATNHRKNQAYLKTFNKPVLNVIAKKNGEILNLDVVKEVFGLITF